MNLFKTFRPLIGLIILFFISFSSVGQESPARFHNEVQELIAQDTAVVKKNLILFTGSSSVRMWKTLSVDFPKFNVLNHGFGGSTMVDLLYYLDTLVTPFQPKQVFIYEGDNDIAAGVSPDDILVDAIRLTRAIKDKLPKTEVLFISPKPSLLRWNLKPQYDLYNGKLKSWCDTQKGVRFIDVWNPMLNSEGNVRNDLFIEDGLHMNGTGYAIWTKVIGPYLKK